MGKRMAYYLQLWEVEKSVQKTVHSDQRPRTKRNNDQWTVVERWGEVTGELGRGYHAWWTMVEASPGAWMCKVPLGGSTVSSVTQYGIIAGSREKWG